MILFFFLLSASLLIAALIIFLYRQLVRLRSMVHEGWSGVDAQLTRPCRPDSQPDRNRQPLFTRSAGTLGPGYATAFRKHAYP